MSGDNSDRNKLIAKANRGFLMHEVFEAFGCE